MQGTTIEEEREDPDLSLLVHPAAEQTTDADIQPKANPATTLPVHVTAEKDTDIEITGSQFVKQTGGSRAAARFQFLMSALLRIWIFPRCSKNFHRTGSEKMALWPC